MSGFLSADPRIVENPRAIGRITFDEMRELSYMGASVLQEEAIFPVREANIPIQIKNTNRPEDTGTVIRETADGDVSEHLITGIAGKKDFLAIHVKKAHMSNEVGVISRALNIVERYGVSVEHIRREIEPDDITMVDRLALVSVVGRNMSRRSGTSGKIFGALGNAGVNIRMITQSSEEISIIVGVDNSDFDRTIGVIYNGFVRDEMVSR